MTVFSLLKKSFIWRTLALVIQFLLLSVYARIFSPEIFGLITSVVVIISFFQLVLEGGMSVAIIEQKKISSRERDGVFTSCSLIGLLLFVVLTFLSDDISDYYDNKEISEIVQFMAPIILFYSLTVVPLASLNKDCKFSLINIGEILSELISFALVWACYFKLNFNPEICLALKYLAYAILRCMLLYTFSYFTDLGMPKVGGNLSYVMHLFKFGKYQFASTFVNYLSRNLDTLLVAKSFGTYSVGIYDKAYQLMKYPIIILTFSIMPALQPAIKKSGLDLKEIEVLHRKFFSITFFIAIITSFFIWANASSIVLILFGDQWGDAADIIKILCLAIPVQVVLSSSSPFIISAQKPKFVLISSAMSSFVTIFSIIISVKSGELTNVAYAIVIAFNINAIQTYYIMYRYVFLCSINNLLINILYILSFSTYLCLFYYTLSSFFELDSLFLNVFVNFIVAIFCIILHFPVFNRVKARFNNEFNL